MQIQRIGSGPRISRAVAYNGMIFLAGQTAADRSFDISGQTNQVLREIERLLVEAGSDKSRILMAQIWLKDMWDLGEMNEVWDAWIAPVAAPARTTAQCELADPGILVEIVITAAAV